MDITVNETIADATIFPGHAQNLTEDGERLVGQIK